MSAAVTVGICARVADRGRLPDNRFAIVEYAGTSCMYTVQEWAKGSACGYHVPFANFCTVSETLLRWLAPYELHRFDRKLA